jgi:N-acetylglutamate synthase-like GNAT family acetyltransferase
MPKLSASRSIWRARHPLSLEGLGADVTRPYKQASALAAIGSAEQIGNTDATERHRASGGCRPAPAHQPKSGPRRANFSALRVARSQIRADHGQLGWEDAVNSFAVHVRDAREQDADTCCSVVRRSISELCTLDHHDDPVTLELWLANKTTANMQRWIRDHHVLVAGDGSAILGVAAMTSLGEIILNYVSPAARFRGVSKALVRGLEARAAKLGILRLKLQSTATAQRFYHAMGFTACGVATKGFGVTMGLPMQKRLRQ